MEDEGRVREGLKKGGNFPTLGGTFNFDIFSHFQKLISKHALNHAKMQRNFLVPSDPLDFLPQIDIPR